VRKWEEDGGGNWMNVERRKLKHVMIPISFPFVGFAFLFG
jgi:hypothetical protein